MYHIEVGDALQTQRRAIHLRLDQKRWPAKNFSRLSNRPLARDAVLPCVRRARLDGTAERRNWGFAPRRGREEAWFSGLSVPAGWSVLFGVWQVISA